METIRILQDTYEKLYALAPVIGDKLEEEFKLLSNLDWKDFYVDSVLQEKGCFSKEWTHLYELDSYYLLEIMRKHWNLFREKSQSDFFSKKNYDLFVNRKIDDSVISIRNNVAHPEYWDYPEDTYQKWSQSLNLAAECLGTSMSKLLYELHHDEKEKLLNYIFSHSTNITMSSPKFVLLSEKTQNSIKETKRRLESQTTAAGIMSLFEDSYFLGKGKKVKEELNQQGLPTFDSILNDVKKLYYGFIKTTETKEQPQ